MLSHLLNVITTSLFIIPFIGGILRIVCSIIDHGNHERQTVYFIGSIQPAQGAKNGARNSWILDKIIVNTSEGNIDRAVIVERMRRRQHGFYGRPSWLMVAVSACLLHTANPAQKRAATTTYNNVQDPPTHGCCCTNDKLFNNSADLEAAPYKLPCVLRNYSIICVYISHNGY